MQALVGTIKVNKPLLDHGLACCHRRVLLGAYTVRTIYDDGRSSERCWGLSGRRLQVGPKSLYIDPEGPFPSRKVGMGRPNLTEQIISALHGNGGPRGDPRFSQRLVRR